MFTATRATTTNKKYSESFRFIDDAQAWIEKHTGNRNYHTADIVSETGEVVQHYDRNGDPCAPAFETMTDDISRILIATSEAREFTVYFKPGFREEQRATFDSLEDAFAYGMKCLDDNSYCTREASFYNGLKHIVTIRRSFNDFTVTQYGRDAANRCIAGLTSRYGA